MNLSTLSKSLQNKWLGPKSKGRWNSEKAQTDRHREIKTRFCNRVIMVVELQVWTPLDSHMIIYQDPGKICQHFDFLSKWKAWISSDSINGRNLYFLLKVHIFWEGHKILRNLHLTLDWHCIGQKWGGDFAKFCELLRIYELYLSSCTMYAYT